MPLDFSNLEPPFWSSSLQVSLKGQLSLECLQIYKHMHILTLQDGQYNPTEASPKLDMWRVLSLWLHWSQHTEHCETDLKILSSLVCMTVTQLAWAITAKNTNLLQFPSSHNTHRQRFWKTCQKPWRAGRGHGEAEWLFPCSQVMTDYVRHCRCSSAKLCFWTIIV